MKGCCVVFHNHKRVPVLPTLYNPSWHLTATSRSDSLFGMARSSFFARRLSFISLGLLRAHSMKAQSSKPHPKLEQLKNKIGGMIEEDGELYYGAPGKRQIFITTEDGKDFWLWGERPL